MVRLSSYAYIYDNGGLWDGITFTSLGNTCYYPILSCSHTVMRHCDFEDIACSGSWMIWMDSSSTFEGCRFTGIDMQGFDTKMISTGTDCSVINSLFANNTLPYSTLFHDYDGGKFYHNTVVGNSLISLFNYHGGATRTATDVKNSVFWGNSISGQSSSPEGLIANSACDFETGANNIVLSNNNDVDQGDRRAPHFLDPARGNYDVMLGSALVDAVAPLPSVATDIKGNARPFGNAADCGCYEFSGGVFCFAPVLAEPDGITGVSAHLSWTPQAYSAEPFTPVATVQMRRDGVAAWTTVTTTSATSYTLTGLMPQTTYWVRVRTTCSDDGYSDWSSPVSITTPCMLHIPGLTLADNDSFHAENMPVSPRSRYSYSQVIYSSEQMNHTRRSIDTIGYIHANGSSISRQFQVYMGNVHRSAFTYNNGFVPSDSLTLVYNGTVTLASGSNVFNTFIPLQTSFDYDPECNLVVAVYDATGTAASDYHYFAYSPREGSAKRTSSSRSIDLASYVNYTGTSDYQPSLYINEVCDNDGCFPLSLVVDSVSDDVARVVWGPTRGYPSLEFKESSDADYTPVTLTAADTAAHSYLFSGLEVNHIYRARIADVCSMDDTSLWTSVNIATVVPRIDRFYVDASQLSDGNASSWASASNNLSSVLARAAMVAETHHNHPQVWVKQGSYSLEGDLDSYTIYPGVEVYGGFEGSEPSDYDLSLRNFEAHPSVLTRANNTENVPILTYTTVDVANQPALWDGFTVTGGSLGVKVSTNTVLNHFVIEHNEGQPLLIDAPNTPRRIYTDDNGDQREYVNTKIFNTVVRNNGEGISLYGGGLYSCEIVNNSCSSTNTESYIITNGNYTEIVNCLIANNVSYGHDVPSALHVINDNTYLANNIIWGNTSSPSALSDFAGGQIQAYNNSYVSRNNAIEGVVADAMLPLQVGTIMLSSSNESLLGPRFVSVPSVSGVEAADGDWSLTASSPCLKQGAWDAEMQGKVPYSAILDLGARQSAYSAAVPLAATYDRHIYVSSNGSGLGTSWSDAASLFDAFIIAHRQPSLDIWMQQGDYATDTIHGVPFCAGTLALYGGFDGSEPATYDLALRDIAAHTTTINAFEKMRHLSIGNGVIDGVNLMGGSAASGGAVYADTLLIANSELRNNVLAGGYNNMGGAVYASEIVNAFNCSFIENGSAPYGSDGGAVNAKTLNVVNALVMGNVAYGTSAFRADTLRVTNATFVHQVNNNGSNIIDGFHYSEVNNSVFWFNNHTNYFTPSTILNYCAADHSAAFSNAVCNHCKLISVDNNTSGDPNSPAFVDSASHNYRLLPQSALLDAGDSVLFLQAVAAMGLSGASLDLDRGGRVWGTNIDMGCFEYQGQLYCNPVSNITVEPYATAAIVRWDINSYTAADTAASDHISQVVYSLEGSSVWDTMVAQGSSVCVLRDLQPERSYALKVRTQCGSYYGDWSDLEVFTTTCVGLVANVEFTDGNSVAYGYNVPTNTANKYSYTQQIIFANELIGRDTIREIAFQYAGGDVLSRDLTLYMGNTTTSQFVTTHSWIPLAGMTQVFSGTVVLDSTLEDGQWVTIHFTTPFVYNGMDNVVLAVDDNTGTSANLNFFYTHPTATQSVIYTSSDVVNLQPYTIESVGGIQISTRSNFRLPGWCDPNRCTPPAVAIGSVSDTSATILWGGASTIEMQYREVGATHWQNISTGQHTITLRSLRPITDYDLRYRTVCSPSDRSHWVDLRFTTDMKRLERIYVSIPANHRADGSSWFNATDNLSWALRYAAENKVRYGNSPDIWVAHGTYMGDTTAPYAFTMVEGVNVYGGFHGYEGDDYDLNTRNFDLNPTVIDGGNRRALLLQPIGFTDTTATTWDGFTFQHGSSDSLHIIDLKAYSCLSHCVIKDNVATGWDILHCNASPGYTSTIVRHNRIENNTASGTGTVICYFNTAASINNLIANNTHQDACVVADNCTMVNCDIVNNLASNNYASSVEGTLSNVYNTIVWGNRRSNASMSANSLSGQIYNCAIENGGSSQGCISLPSGNSGVVNTFVSFVEPSAGVGAAFRGGDWHLAANSICIDHGSVRFLDIPTLWCNDATTDLAGGLRVQGDSVDMGCYESGNPALPLPEYADGIIYVDARSTALDRDGTSWEKALDKLTDALTFAAFAGPVDIWVAEGTYMSNENRTNAFVGVGGVNVYGGFAGNEPATYDLSQRDFEAHTTILTGMNTQRVIYSEGGSSWDGFTITAGRCSDNGGAVYLDHGALRNCIIHHNQGVLGGAVYGLNVVIEDCEFSYNKGADGGALYANDAFIRRVRMDHNTSSSDGGALYGSNIVLTNSLIYGNCATRNGFAMYLGGDNFVNNVSVVRNYLTIRNTSRSPIYLSSSGSVFRNTVVWGNLDGYAMHVNFGVGLKNNVPYTYDAAYCAVENYPSDDATNINLDSNNVATYIGRQYPSFRSPIRGDFSLGERSACLDRGQWISSHPDIPEEWLLSDTLDLDGKPRINGGLDMGCFENWNDQLCLEPHNVRFDYVGGYSAAVLWDCDNAEPDDNYELQYASGTDGDWQTISAPGRQYAVIDGLTPETAYRMRIRHQCGDGEYSPYTDEVVFTTDCPMRSGNVTLGNYHGEDGLISPLNTAQAGYTYMYIHPSQLDSVPRRIDSISFQYFFDQPMTRGLSIFITPYQDRINAMEDMLSQPPAASALVFSGMVDFDNRGHDHWVGIPLDRSYFYDGNSILMLTVLDTTSGINSFVRDVPRFESSYCPDSVYFFPRNFYPQGGVYYSDCYRANIRFSGECDTMDCISPRLSVFEITDSSARLVWSGGNNGAPVDVQMRAKNNDYVDIADVASANGWTIDRRGNEIVVSGLSQHTAYEARIRSHCASDNLGLWNAADFTTPVLYHDIIYVAPRPRGLADGSSWDNATSDINRATSLASAVNEHFGVMPPVWVARGTYYGDTTDSRGAFLMPVGVKVYGGFEGNEPPSFDYESFVANPELTVLDARERQRVLYQKSLPLSQDQLIKWSGFTITRGSSSLGGGAFLLRYAVLENCIVKNNTAQLGGGVYIRARKTERTIYLQDQNGGERQNYYTTVLSNCKVLNNRSSDQGGGVYGHAIAMVNTLVANNTSIGVGGVYCDSAYHVLINTTIVNNQSLDDKYSGIYADGATLRNCIVWGNRKAGSDNGDYQVGGGTFIRGIYGTAVENGVNGWGTYYLSPSNTGEFYSPAFVHPSSGAGLSYSDGDWHLTSESFCVNRTDTTAVAYRDRDGRMIVYYNNSNSKDLDHNDRVQMDSVDMGCYESPFRRTESPVYDSRIYVTATGGGNRCGNSWDNAMSSINAAQHVAASYGLDNVWVAGGTYSGTAQDNGSIFTMLGGIGVYGGFEGNEPGSFDLADRDFANNTSVLDGRNRYRVLASEDIAATPVTPSTIWDGFTIRNGRAVNGQGGGARLTRTFRLNNCIIENCFARTGGGVSLALRDLENIDLFVDPSGFDIDMDNNDSYVPIAYDHHLVSALTNCIVRHNEASDTAGGVRSISGYLENCLIADNHSYGVAGGVEAICSNIIGCAIVNNVQSVDTSFGGGLLQITDSIPIWVRNNSVLQTASNAFIVSGYVTGQRLLSSVTNSIVWGNRSGLIENSNHDGRFYITNSAIGGSASGSNILLELDNDGSDLSKNYVRFADPAQDDYSLTEMSDVLNLGLNDLGICNLDLLSKPRQVGDAVDLGPIEFQETDVECPAPYGVRAVDITTNTISLTWQSSGSRWAVTYALRDETPEVVTVDDNHAVLTGLTPHRDYTIRVRTVCNDTAFSAQSSALVVRTSCDTASMAPLSDFIDFYPLDEEVIKGNKVNFSWNSLPQATSYDLYIWPETDTVEPVVPYRGHITTPYIHDLELPKFKFDQVYYWKVVAWNECLSKVSDVHTFTSAGNRRLHVTALDCSAPMSGHEMTVEWTIRNDGSGRTPPGDVWYDKVWISRYCDIARNGDSETQHLLATYSNVRALNPGEYYTNRKNVRIPDTCMGNWYLMVLTDTLEYITPSFSQQDGALSVLPDPYTPSLSGIPYPFYGHTPTDVDADSVPLAFMGQMYWGDHFSYKRVEIAQSPLPDVVPTALVHPVDVYSRTDIDVTYRVENRGEADAEGSWTDKVVLVKEEDVVAAGLLDPMNGFTGNVREINSVPIAFAATYTHTGGLAKDTFYEGHLTFALPMEMHGNYYMYVQANSTNSLYESLNYNNNVYSPSQLIRVTMFPTPDVVVDTIDSPVAVPLLSGFTFNYTIKNQGTADCAPAFSIWLDSVFLSPDSVFRTKKMRFLTVVEHSDTIMRDSVLIVTVADSMPDNIKGDWYIFVKTNAANTIFEYNADTNNVLCSRPIRILAPDLEVRNITYQGPDTISVGQDLIVEYDVVNVGNADAHRDTWRDGIYLAHSYMFSFATAVRVGDVRHKNGLEIDSSYHVSVPVRIPDDLAGYWTIHVYSDRDSSLYEQDQELNNHTMGDNRINVLQPDLAVINVSMGDTLFAGRRTTVDWDVVNQGRGTIYDKFNKHDIYVDDFNVVSSTEWIDTLRPYDTIHYQLSFMAPCFDGASGGITVRTDVENAVYESVENNNLSAPLVVPMGSADFAVDTVVIPTAIASGQVIPISWRLSNVGTVDIVNMHIPHRIYMSHTDEYDTIQCYHWEIEKTLTLHVGESVTVTHTLRVPYEAEGSYIFHVVGNDPTLDAAACEAADVASNVGSSNRFDVALSDCPDLVIESLSMPDWMYTAASARIPLQLKNMGVAATYAASKQKIYLSSSATEYYPEGEMGCVLYEGTLYPDASTMLMTYVTIPDNTSAGHYYVWAVADAEGDIYERDGETNNAAVMAELEVRVNPFDLGIISFTGPDTIVWNNIHSAAFTIRNFSDVWAPATRYDAIFLSNDSVLDVDDVRLSATNRPNSILPGGTENITFSFQVPLGLDSVVYLIAATDYLMTTPDVLLENNTAVLRMPVKSIPTPDLMVTSVRLLHDTLMSGERDTMIYTVTNVGDGPLVHARWTDQVFLSADTVFSFNDIRLATEIMADTIIGIDTLYPGQSFDWGVGIRVPLPHSGDYHLLTYTNARNAFFETSRTNNIHVLPVYVDITRPSDLVVRSIDGPDSVTLGESIVVEWDVVNIGEDKAQGGGLVSLLYLSLDDEFDSGDRLLASDSTAIDLNTGDYLHRSVRVRMASVPEDRYYFIVVTDARNAFYEVNERNNTTVASFPVTVKVRELPFNTPVADTFYNGLMNDYKLIVGDHRNQTVLLHLDLEDSTINAANHIYVSYNSIGDNLNYTYSSVGQVTATPETYIPNTTGGYYGVSVFTSLIDDTVMHADISADEIPFGLYNVTPNYGGNTGEVTVELRGSRFRPDMKASMYRGTDTIVAKNVRFADYYSAYATFDLTGADTGVYDVGIDNFCDGEALLPQSFTVEPGAPRNLAYIISAPHGSRIGKTVALQFEFGNQGNTDIVNTAVKIQSFGSPITLNPNNGEENSEVIVPIRLPGSDDCVLPPGARGTVTIYCVVRSNLYFLYTEQPYVNE